jgi:hypothetical protein
MITSELLLSPPYVFAVTGIIELKVAAPWLGNYPLIVHTPFFSHCAHANLGLRFRQSPPLVPKMDEFTRSCRCRSIHSKQDLPAAPICACGDELDLEEDTCSLGYSLCGG